MRVSHSHSHDLHMYNQSSYSNFPKKKKAKKALFEEKKHFLKKKSTFCGAFYHIFWFEIKSCFSDFSLIMAKM